MLTYYIPGVGVELKINPCLSLRAEYQHSLKAGPKVIKNDGTPISKTNQVRRLNLGLTYHI